MKKRLKVLVLFDTAGTPPDDQDFSREFRTEEWKTEAHVVRTLKKLGHDVHTLGIYEEIGPLYEALKKVSPDIVFNLTEHFGGKGYLDRAVVGLFEMMGVSYTGCGAKGLMLSRHKALAKKLLSFHGIKNPRFTVVPRSCRSRISPCHSQILLCHSGESRNPLNSSASAKLRFPCIVKMANDDASVGISQASCVRTEKALLKRIRFIHKKLKDDALVEEFVLGRELYVGVIGNKKVRVLPAKEMVFGKMPDRDRQFATHRTKWNDKYRKRYKIRNTFARLSPEVEKQIANTCRQIYQILGLDGYARIDLRLTPHNEIVFIEANPNPFLAHDEDFALSAGKAGLTFGKLLQKILELGLEKAR